MMDYTQNTASAAAQYATQALIKEGTLVRLTTQVKRATERAQQIGEQLSAHASQVHGPNPPLGTETACAPVRSGLIGELEDALDRLDDAQSYLAVMADRNCSLA